jgi:hypothetical protein
VNTVALSVPEKSQAQRRLVFISHANPEENDFARWLSAQLASAGYEVWSDVSELIGGEVFWDNIEDAIRNHSAKFVVAVSRAACVKNGVLDEVQVAVATERSQSLANFVVPLRIDDIDFADFRANISRKNAIDFSGSWAHGLDNLFKVLRRDLVPAGAVGPNNVAAWCQTKLNPSQRPRTESETLVSNWLPVQKLPATVSLFSLVDVESSKVPAVMKAMSLPWFPYYRLIGTFGTEADLRADLSPELNIQLEYHLTLESFLRGRSRELPGMEPREAKNHVVSLIRQSWNRTMAGKGLSLFEMSGGAAVWYFKKGQIEGDKAYFFDAGGKRRYRQVVGRSERRKVNWHLGFQGKAVFGPPLRIVMRPAVLFSQDGQTLLSSAPKMHRLRRGFCRSWWNPTWRDLLLAYVAWISGGQASFPLNAGIEAEIPIGAQPLAFRSDLTFADPPTKSQPGAPPENEETPPDEPTEEDDDDNFFDEEEFEKEGAE